MTTMLLSGAGPAGGLRSRESDRYPHYVQQLCLISVFRNQMLQPQIDFISSKSNGLRERKIPMYEPISGTDSSKLSDA
jgi:hypothetical protein